MTGVEGAGAPWLLAGSVVAFWLVRETWGAVISRRKERTETDANINLVDGLSKRIDVLERYQTEISKRLEEEMRLRRLAEEEAHRLRLRVMSLESILRGLGAVVPDVETVTP